MGVSSSQVPVWSYLLCIDFILKKHGVIFFVETSEKNTGSIKLLVAYDDNELDANVAEEEVVEREEWRNHTPNDQSAKSWTIIRGVKLLSQ